MAAPAGDRGRAVAVRVVRGEYATLIRYWPMLGAVIAGVFTYGGVLIRNPLLSGSLCLVGVVASVVLGLSPLLRDAGGRPTQGRVKPGELRVGLLHLRARDVVAATTADAGERFSVALRRRGQARPVLLELFDEADVRVVLDALGTGDSGAGTGVPFDYPRSGARLIDRAASILGIVLAFVLAMGVTSSLTTPNAPIDATLAVGYAVWAIAAAALYWVRFKGREIVLGRHGLRIGKGQELPYTDITEVATDMRTLVLSLTSGETVRVAFARVDEEAQTFARHLRAAVARAHGPPLLRRDPPPLLATVRAPREWIAELDLAAEAGDRSGYRERGLDLDDVETVLNDADRPLPVRAAAARVLVKRGVDRARVEETLATFRGENATERARIVAGLEQRSEDEAAAALEELAADAEEMTR